MSDEPVPIREAIAALVAGAGDALAVDLLARSGIRADHDVPRGAPAQPLPPPGAPRPQDGTSTLVDTMRSGDDAPAPGDRGPADPDALLLQHAPRLQDRYELLRILGEGGMGEVHLARDRNLGRQIAVKTIPPTRMDSKRLARFVAEARITAQLEHPGIVPVHDLFISGDGDIYYTMKRVQGVTLRQLLDDLASDDPEAGTRWNLNRLLAIFRSACQAVAYAHTRRVIHRDLKPDNVMIGDFGEVLVMDWGVARMLDDAPEELLEVVQEGASLLRTADGAMVGSPAYMAPEQLQGESSALGPTADVFSLGVMLYEILALRRPFVAQTLGRLLYLVAKGEFLPPSQAAPGREVPPDVEEICLRALSRDPAERYPDAGALTLKLEEFLDRVRPRQEADRLIAEGKDLMLRFAKAASDSEESELRARALQAGLQTWDPLDMKRLFWTAEKETADAVAAADTLFGDCEAAFESALSHVPNYRPANEGLADLYWIRFLQAEEAHDARWMRRWQELICRYAEDRYKRRLDGVGTLSLSSDPPGAEAMLLPLMDEDGRQVAGTPEEVGTTPVDRRPTGMGAYMLELRREGYATVRSPIVLGRLQNLDLFFRLPAAVPEGFLPIPAGPSERGGDPAAISGLPGSDRVVGDFAIARYPVTIADYLEFLSDLTRRDPAEALRRSPRARGSRGVRQEPLFQLPPDGSFELPFVDRDGTTWHAEQPIVSIGHDDACAFAEWLSEREEPSFRLPTESEWEKAARGLDRRIFPWGNRFDASFCVMSESSPDAPDLPAIGSVPTDVSPYGVRDMAGGVRDWCSWDEGSDPLPGRYPIRGGSYGTVEIYCRCASRSIVEEEYVGSHVGFRLVVKLDP